MKIQTPPPADQHPETLMLSYGYDPNQASHAVKPPMYLTSTFSFKSAEHGKAYAEVINGLRKQEPNEDFSDTYIYSRDTNPNLEIFERRLAIWDGAAATAAFESGMGAISSAIMTCVSAGDTIVMGEPTYGCTDFLVKHILPRFGVRHVGFNLMEGNAALDAVLSKPEVARSVAMIYLETPCNPSNAMADIAHAVAWARKLSTADRNVVVAVDNTFLGPLFQTPLKHGADLVLYSATKYINGHSDILAGACSGASAELIGKIKQMRAMIGTIPSPHTCWLLTRSLETMKLRMMAQLDNAQKVAAFLAAHPKVKKVYYLGHLKEGDPQYAIYKKQCEAPGAMISFDVNGGEQGAFRFLNALKVFHLAVSLGGNESLAEHPATMTHAEVDPEDRLEGGITESMVRLSIGIEHCDDLIADLKQALATV